MSKPKLSLCMIVKNEEKFLPGCLESVKDIVDEIIIVDTGSADKTVEIARSYGAKVFFSEWGNDFSLARNESIKHATGEWILTLDADERLNPGQEEKLKKYLSMDFDGLYVKVLNLGKDGRKTINESIRLSRRKEGVKFEGKIHEQIGPSILKSGGKLAKTDITITHLGYAQTDEVMNKKYERNLSLLFEQIKENPNDAYSYYHIGIIKILMGKKEEGIKYLEKAINIPRENSNLGDPLRAAIYNILGKCEIQNENFSEALKYFNESRKLAPMQVSSYYYTGLVHMKRSNFPSAINSFEKALKNLYLISEGNPLDTSLDDLIELEVIHFKLFLCYFKLGNFSKTKEHLGKILSNEEFYKGALDVLVNEYINHNRNAIQLLRYISEIKPNFEIFKILSGIYQIEGVLETAVENLKRALQFKDDDEIRYNLGVCLVGLKRFDEVVESLTPFLNRENSKFFESSIKVLALSYLSLGEITDALNCYKILLARDPNNETLREKIKSISQLAFI